VKGMGSKVDLTKLAPKPPKPVLAQNLSMIKKRLSGKGNAPDAGSEEGDSGFVAQAHEKMDNVDSIVSNAGAAASIADRALKYASPKLGAVASGLGKGNQALSYARAAVDAGRLLTDQDHWEKTQEEGADGSVSPVEFGMNAVDIGQLPTTVVRATGMVGGIMDANREAGEALAMKDQQDKLMGVYQKKKERNPLTYGQGGSSDVPPVDPERDRQIQAAKEAFEDQNLESMTMELVRNIIRGNQPD